MKKLILILINVVLAPAVGFGQVVGNLGSPKQRFFSERHRLYLGLGL